MPTWKTTRLPPHAKRLIPVARRFSPRAFASLFQDADLSAALLNKSKRIVSNPANAFPADLIESFRPGRHHG